MLNGVIICFLTKPKLELNNVKMATTSGSRGRFLESPSRRAHSVDGCSSMDLSFVTERILALSFPPEMEPGVYRDALHQAANMLQTKHGDNYMVMPAVNSSWLVDSLRVAFPTHCNKYLI